MLFESLHTQRAYFLLVKLCTREWHFGARGMVQAAFLILPVISQTAASGGGEHPGLSSRLGEGASRPRTSHLFRHLDTSDPSHRGSPEEGAGQFWAPLGGQRQFWAGCRERKLRSSTAAPQNMKMGSGLAEPTQRWRESRFEFWALALLRSTEIMRLPCEKPPWAKIAAF